MKIMILSIIGCLLLNTSFQVPAHRPYNAIQVCLSANEADLASIINQYRIENELNPIPLSISLSLVAKEHVKDLVENEPYDDDHCNPHSWSSKGIWEACCYKSGKDGDCMWNKPRELTSYNGDGYEIVMAEFNSEFPQKEVTAISALEAWKDSPKHKAVIINENIWKKTEWNAMGIGIYQGFAAVWFGQEPDIEGSPGKCP